MPPDSLAHWISTMITMVRPRSGVKSAALEVFKFGLYLFVPFAAMVTYGNPEWYKQVVVPVCPSTTTPNCLAFWFRDCIQYKEQLMPKDEETYVRGCLFTFIPQARKLKKMSVETPEDAFRRHGRIGENKGSSSWRYPILEPFFGWSKCYSKAGLIVVSFS